MIVVRIKIPNNISLYYWFTVIRREVVSVSWTGSKLVSRHPFIGQYINEKIGVYLLHIPCYKFNNVQ